MSTNLHVGDVWTKGRSHRRVKKIVGSPPELVVYATTTQRNQIANIEAWEYWARTAQLDVPGATEFLEGSHAVC